MFGENGDEMQQDFNGAGIVADSDTIPNHDDDVGNPLLLADESKNALRMNVASFEEEDDADDELLL